MLQAEVILWFHSDTVKTNSTDHHLTARAPDPKGQWTDLYKVTSPCTQDTLFFVPYSRVHCLSVQYIKYTIKIIPNFPQKDPAHQFSRQAPSKLRHLLLKATWDFHMTMTNLPLVRNQQCSKQQNWGWNNYWQNHIEAGIILIFISTWKSKEFR